MCLYKCPLLTFGCGCAMYLTFRWRGELWMKAPLYSRIEVTFSGIGYIRHAVRAQWHELWSVCILVEVSTVH